MPETSQLRSGVTGQALAEDWKTSDFHCQELAAVVYLLTYTLVLNGRRTRRATIWQQGADGWTVLYHRGTVVQDL
ncbi:MULTISPECIES: hypothetical protein [Streptomyces]|uniref:DUF4440 domain-containing protein n=1 Tax=Streptomyces siderophoricus TaxID=2802281 RepID=A0ABS1MRY8_9ACTN|nr:hypothetical protein [Streptomyces sp. 9-7]MBL1090517.1 hypothetical protein [Streptomyces sp. 9-7]